MSGIPVLYHAEQSSRSQMCVIALVEKGIKYQGKILTLFGDQHDPHYLRDVNPNGTVPALEHKGNYFRDSKDIVYYADKLPSDKPKLTFEDRPEAEKNVIYYTELVSNLNLGILTFGSFFKRHLTKNSLAPLALNEENGEADIRQRLLKLEQTIEANPDLEGAIKAIVNSYKSFLAIMGNEDVLLKSIDECDKVFDEIEKELQKQKETAGVTEFWLCGDRFTTVDIYLSVVLHRLVFVGLADRLFLSNRPLIMDYYQRVLQRPSFKIACYHANDGKYWLPTE